jgi:hypothetical protein
MEKLIKQFLGDNQTTELFQNIMELSNKLSLIMEALPPIDIRKLRIKDKDYIAILIEVKRKDANV